MAYPPRNPQMYAFYQSRPEPKIPYKVFANRSRKIIGTPLEHLESERRKILCMKYNKSDSFRDARGRECSICRVYQKFENFKYNSKDARYNSLCRNCENRKQKLHRLRKKHRKILFIILSEK